MDYRLQLTLLSEEQIWGDSALDIFKKYGTKCVTTDLAILTSTGLNGESCWWWTRSSDGDGGVRIVDEDGSRYYDYRYVRNTAVRPALQLSSEMYSKISPNKVRGYNGVYEVEYGEYPQMAPDERTQKELEKAYSRSAFRRTGKKYTFDSTKSYDYKIGFNPIEYDELEYNGKKYIRFVATCNSYCEKLANGMEPNESDPIFVEVQPMKWLLDEKTKIMVCKKSIVTGIRFQHPDKRYDGKFEETEMYDYMQKHLAKDLLNSTVITKSVTTEEVKVEERKSRLQKLNPDTTSPQDRRRMTDTEIIHSWIEAGQSVLLRGPSGIGKTERITSLYPSLIYIKLTNNMFPEKVVGSMNLQTGQSIPPDFAKQALLACANEDERKLISENIQNIYDLADEIYERSKNSDEKIVIMLDELLNVKPAVQSLVYTLVLNRLVETGKGLKLPANTVVVATGNQKKYSSVAEDLAEPLEKRFDHILDMEPKVGEWINEYAIPHKIHPSVIGYILSKYMQSGRSESIADMGYFYEEPEVGEKKLDQNGCKGRTNDPRGWVSISNTLYAFEEDLRKGKFVGKDVEHLLEVSINSKLREEWANEFFNFYNIPSLSVDEVVNSSFSQADLPRDINERFACVTSLLLADENQVGQCREFIREHCDPEYLQLYDICWAGSDERRMMKITELQEMAMISNESVGMRR